ncbi:hypothetical protein HK405_003834 [Cladochytrium tenue]|nr:hypothetical protein HK405_003834 [Cladochytrium tenue]
MPNTDQVLHFVAEGIAVLLLFFTLVKIIGARTAFNWICLFAAFCLVVKATGQLIYLYILWANCIPRYFITFFFLNAAKIALYALHERRLSVFFASHPDAASAGRAFRAFFYVLYAAYCTNAVGQVVVNCRDCYTTASGGLSISSTTATNIKLTHYSIEMALGLTLLAGNAYALLGLMRASRQVATMNIAPTSNTGFTYSTYSTVLGSDAARFLAVLPVEIYKLSVSYDPSGNSGVFPAGPGNGNNGLQQLLDAYKVAVLLLLLHFPSAYAKFMARHFQSTKSHSKGSKSATYGGIISSDSGSSVDLPFH